LNYEEIRKEIKEDPKNKKYGNYLKKLLTEYNTINKNDKLEYDKEQIRIFKFVTQSFAKTNLDIFTSNAKIFDSTIIKKFCQTIFNTNFYLENQHNEEFMLYHFQNPM
jgi:hypothetical protein